MSYDVSKLVKLGALKSLAERINKDFARENDFEELEAKVEELTVEGGEPNVIESVSVNGENLEVVNKNVDVTVPTKVSELENDSEYQTADEVLETVDSAVADLSTSSFEIVDSIPTPDEAEPNVLYLVMNDETGYYDIYALIDDEVVRIDDTGVDLDGYVKEEEGKGLSSNDYTDEEKDKLAGIEEGANYYVHPEYTSCVQGLYKFVVDETGHVSSTEAVTADDIAELGYTIATDEEVEEMLNETLSA